MSTHVDDVSSSESTVFAEIHAFVLPDVIALVNVS